MRATLIALLSAASLLAAPVHALTAKQTVEKEVVVQNPDGTESTSREPADRVVPGERLVYTVEFVNDGTEPATDLVMTQPVPAEVLFIDGSADRPGAEVTVSTDGGASFAPRGAATVVRDGETVRAQASDITHVRWKIAGPVAPGAADSIAYKGTLK